jgi:hypothetical protein
MIRGGALLWILVGDAGRAARKYGERAVRFLLQEAGHLMQNLCLLSTGLGLATVPLGGYFERAIARQLLLPATDLVLYVGGCGKPVSYAKIPRMGSVPGSVSGTGSAQRGEEVLLPVIPYYGAGRTWLPHNRGNGTS